MNQILITKFKKYSKTKQFKVQFYISIFSILVIGSIFVFYNLKINEYTKKSNSFSNNYDIYKLYSNGNNKIIYKDSDILGYISIPKLSINYPFFYGYNEELLKISPCRFYGNMPPEKGNLCITAHNYNDNRFFSKLNILQKSDKIIIQDNYKNKYTYYVSKIYEVDENNLSPVKDFDPKKSSLTLITCNNLNKKRIIVRAY